MQEIVIKDFDIFNRDWVKEFEKLDKYLAMEGMIRIEFPKSTDTPRTIALLERWWSKSGDDYYLGLEQKDYNNQDNYVVYMTVYKKEKEDKK